MAMKIAIICLALVSGASYVLRGNIIGSDGLGYYAPLRSFAIDCDFDLTNEFRDFNPHHHCVQDYTKKTVTGVAANKYSIGPSLLWAPFFYVAHAITRITGGPADGYSIWYQILIAIASMTYGIIGILLVYAVVQRFFERRFAAIGVILTLWGTNLLYYFVFEPSMSHLVSLFSVALFVFTVVRYHGRQTVVSAGITGCAFGLMALVRTQNVLFGFLLAMEFFCGNREHCLFTSPRKIVAYVAAAFITFLPQLLYWKIIFGSYFVFSYGTEAFDFAHPRFLMTLLGSRHGLVYWTPLTAVALLGLVTAIPSQQWKWFVCFLMIFLLQWYLCSSWWCWWFGTSFGQRLMADIAIVFALGFAAVAQKAMRWTPILRLAVTGAIVGLVLWNGFLTVSTAANNASKNPLQIGWVHQRFDLN